MRFINHLIQEGLAKKPLRSVKGLSAREVEIMMTLMAKALIASYAEHWKFSRDDLDHPMQLIEDGIMQDADAILDINYKMLWQAVEAEVVKFE